MSGSIDNRLKYIKVRTRKNSSPQGKPRVYFTCHPRDFERYFDKVCEDIFKTQDCAIYYTVDMSAPIPEEYRETDLGQMNLFVMPITFSLLTQPSRAMDGDFALAKETDIPVLPLMMESGIDEFYKKRFEKRQYLSPYSHDLTEVGYEKKLEQYLSSVLFDDKTAERVRKAFDAYIFLSYRKKDRHHANELMGLIHKNPMYRDVAIWYDEFLTPGEDFDQNIQNALEKSDLFALLVTPNLVNEQNYVQTVEYPRACDAGKRILPAEMVRTDRGELEDKYPALPACVDAHIDAALGDGVGELLRGIALKPNEDDPEHNYLIGLAYLDGIDVEVDKDYAIKMITSAAEADLPEAMEKLSKVYKSAGADQKAIDWAQKYVDFCTQKWGKTDERTLEALNLLCTANIYKCAPAEKVRKLRKQLYRIRLKINGKNDEKTLQALNNYAGVCHDKQRLRLCKKEYALRRKVNGEDDEKTLQALYQYANACLPTKTRKALKLFKKANAILGTKNGESAEATCNAYDNMQSLRVRVPERVPGSNSFSDRDFDMWFLDLYIDTPYMLIPLGFVFAYPTLTFITHYTNLIEKPIVLAIVAMLYLFLFFGGHVPVFKLCKEILIRIYLCKAKHFRENIFAHYYTEFCHCLNTKGINDERIQIAIRHMVKWHYYPLSKYMITAFEKTAKDVDAIDFEENDDTLYTIWELAWIYKNCSMYDYSIKMFKKHYALGCKLKGDESGDALQTLKTLAGVYKEHGEYDKAVELYERWYNSSCLDKKSDQADRVLDAIIDCHTKLGHDDLADQYIAERMNINISLFGEKTIGVKNLISNMRWNREDGDKMHVRYEKMRDELGDTNVETRDALLKTANCYYSDADYSKALELFEHAYKISVATDGEAHSKSMELLLYCALRYRELGDKEKYLELTERGYSIKCQISEEDDPDTLDWLELLAHAYSDLGNHEKSAELFEKAYNLRVKAFGEDNYDTLVVRRSWAMESLYLGNYAKTCDLLEKLCVSFNKLESFSDEEERLLTGSLAVLAEVYRVLDNCDASVATYQKMVSLGVADDEVLARLGEGYIAQGHYKKALNLFKKVFKKQYSEYSLLSPEEIDFTISLVSNLAFTYYKLGSYKKATELYKKVLLLCVEFKGITHSDTLEVIEQLKKPEFIDCRNLVENVISRISDKSVSTKILRNHLRFGSSVANIQIPDDVGIISNAPFFECCCLKSIGIPDSVMIIGDSAFWGCRSLAEITMGSGVISIGARAFEGCRRLRRIVFDGTKKQWEAIEKADRWRRKTGLLTVYCTDGKIRYLRPM